MAISSSESSSDSFQSTEANTDYDLTQGTANDSHAFEVGKVDVFGVDNEVHFDVIDHGAIASSFDLAQTNIDHAFALSMAAMQADDDQLNKYIQASEKSNAQALAFLGEQTQTDTDRLLNLVKMAGVLGAAILTFKIYKGR